MADSGLVFNVQRASFHDGPGIRTVVFLKGCPLSCKWCHNPEGLAAAPQVLSSPERCLECGACRAACPHDGGPLGAGRLLGEDGCLGCRACVEACPSGAREVAGRELDVAALMAEVLRDRLVFDTSGGGVTFSGGEPLAQGRFLLGCLDACRAEGVRTAVETCGVAPRDLVVAVAERAGLLLWDLKHSDEQRHCELTGGPLAAVLGNLAAASAAGAEVWLRVPLIAAVNDGASTLAGMARMAAAVPGVRRVQILPYHGTAAAKFARLGRVPPSFAAPERAGIEAAAAAFRAAGLHTTVGGHA